MKKRAVAILLSAVTMVSLLAGCGSSTTSSTSNDSTDAADTTAAESTADEASADGKIKLTVTYRDPDDNGEDNYMYKWIMQAYENWDQKDSVEIVTQAIVASDSDYVTKIQTEMQDASTSPDLFFEDTFQLNTDVAAGYVTNITDYVANWDEWNDGSFIESLKQGVQGTDGDYYAIPTSTDVRGLWYNKDVMEQAGLGRDWQPESWQDILDACQAIKDNCADDVVPIWFACSNTEAEATSMNTFEMLLSGTEDWLNDDATGVWNVDSQGIKDSLEFLKTCKDNDYIGTLSEVFDASDWTYANLYMSTGKLGIYLNGSWGYADYLQSAGYPMQGYTDETLSDGLGYALMPKQNGGGYTTMSGGWSWAIAENSSVKDAAFDFATELMKSDNYITYLVGSGNLTVKTGMNEYEEYASKLYVEQDEEMAENASFRPHDENYSKVSSYIYEMVDTIMRNGTSIEDAMADYKSSVISVVGEDKVQ